MGKIQVLDCTLRDGAYIVNAKFGSAAIKGIIHKLNESGIEIIECGWLKDKEHEEGTSFYHVPGELSLYAEKKPNVTYAAMIDYNRYDDSILPDFDESGIDAIRVVFPYGKVTQGLEIAGRIREKGYRIYLQAANTLAYSREDLISLAKEVNAFGPVGISIVDTFGAMYEDELLEIAGIMDEHLDPSVKLGFHSHNNQQMAFANSVAFIKYFEKGKRDIIVDSSLCGMGRGAGNATTELVTSYLNRKNSKNYDMDAILDAIDTYMTPFQEKYRWGYSTPYFIAGTYCCHVNNIAYLLDNHRTNAKDMRNIIESLPPSDRLKYDYDILEEKYIENQSRLADDEKTLKELSEIFSKKEAVLIAPGKSSLTHMEEIKEYCRKNNAVTIAVNALLSGYDYDYLFLTNTVRYDYAKETHTEEFGRLNKIVLSSIKTKPDEKEYIINFNRVIKRGWPHFDNAVICCLRLMAAIPGAKVAIAGFDGFKKDYNESYADPNLPTISRIDDVNKLNEEITEIYRDFRKGTKELLPVRFITESIFEGEE